MTALLWAWASGLWGFYLLSLAAALRFYRRGPLEGPVAPMTVIKPLKGADPELEDNLRSLLAADPTGALQVLFAVEGEDDPACAVARRVAAASGGRAEVVLTGPPGERMGKAHNMIEALKAARHDRVVFSDSDVVTDRAVLVETSRAFDDGADGLSALPDASGRGGATDALIGVCFNHCFVPAATLLYRLGVGCFFAGGWMAVRKAVLKRVGGLERFERSAADDFAISQAVRETGGDARLVPRLVRIREHGGSFPELAGHILKWTRIIRGTQPLPFFVLPLFTPAPLAGAAAAGALLDAPWWRLAAALWLSVAAARAAAGLLFDLRVCASRFPLWVYPILPLVDLAFVGFWAASWAGGTIEWRGARYRVRSGGTLERIR